MVPRRMDECVSIRLVKFFMWCVGFWTSETKTEERVLKIIAGCTLSMILMAWWIELTELYVSIGDFYAISYTACCTMPLIVILVRFVILLFQREKLLKMVRYTQEKFWNARYNEYGKKIMDDINKRGVILMGSFTFSIEIAVFCIMLTPIYENRGKNESERILPFNWYVGIDMHVSPNFEILFALEAAALVHMGICYCSFDNLLVLLCMHTTGQFKMLQNRMETIFERIGLADTLGSLDKKAQQAINEEVRGCILQHQELIWYSKQIQNIFKYSTLTFLCVSSLTICVVGFQMFFVRGTWVRRLIFIAQTNDNFCHLFVFTLTAHHLLDESRAVGNSMYNANWEVLPHQCNRRIRNAVHMMIVRSARPCCISAGGFCPVSLETFMAVMSTAISYFTLLRHFLIQ